MSADEGAIGFAEWLTNEVGVSNDCYQRLISYGCDSISMLKACSLSDIEDISHDASIEKIDKLKLKVMIKQMSECDHSKHLIIGMEERRAMLEIDEKIKVFEQIIERIEHNETNHIVEESKKCQTEINKTFEKLYDSLKIRQNCLLNKLQQITKDKKNELTQRKAAINRCLSKTIQVKQECHKLLTLVLRLVNTNKSLKNQKRNIL